MDLIKEQLEQLRRIASKPAPKLTQAVDQELVQQSLQYLASGEAISSVEVDAYWPKWNSPWWHVLLLHEMGLTSRVPERIVERIIFALQNDFLKFFPFTEEEVPPGADPIKNVACHCQLGTMHQFLKSYGVDVDKSLPWLRPWYLRYQIEDGGLNCDEAAYTKPVRKSSVVSTLPPMEALLDYPNPDLSSDEIAFLDRGANYLLKRKLFRSASAGKVIGEHWLQICFPRFYNYDILRGLAFLLAWSRRFKKRVPISAINETIEIIDNAFPDARVHVQRAAWMHANTRVFDSQTGAWTKAPASTYPLLNATSEVGSQSIYLTESWSKTRADLLALIEEDLVEAVCEPAI